MILEYIAIIVYGVLAHIAALVLSSQAGSATATALVFASAGLVYVFQTIQLTTGKTPFWLWAMIIGALLASVIVSLGTSYHVL